MARFRLDRKGLEELHGTVRLGDYADSIRDEAKLIAPVGKAPPAAKRGADYVPGQYRNSIRAVGKYVYAGNDIAYYAWMLEYGTVDTPVFATLRRATRIAGLRMEENRTAVADSIFRQGLRFSDDLTPAQARELARDRSRQRQREQRQRRRR